MKEPKTVRNSEARTAESGKDATIQESLLRLVHYTTSNEALRDDLTQEALVHLWMVKTRRPGQTNSWYLQSCKFRLQHYLNSGRSIDSAKRHRGRVSLEPDTSDPGENFELIDAGISVLSSVSARDLIAQLSRNLLPEEQAVLSCLADGLGSREIGRKLNVSHTLIMKRRQKLAGMLRELETISVPALSAPQLNATPRHNGGRASNGLEGPSQTNLRQIGTTDAASHKVTDQTRKAMTGPLDQKRIVRQVCRPVGTH